MRSTRRHALLAALRGALGAVSLPWLESLASAAPRARGRSTDPRPPIRLACLFFPNGVRADRWTPAWTHDPASATPPVGSFDLPPELSPILSPLAPHRDDVIVLTNLWNRGSRGGDGHYVKCSGFLTGTTIKKTTGRDLDSGGISLDQLAARHASRQTPLRSLELSVDPVSAGVDTNVGYTRLYGSHISWSSPTTPVAREQEPRRAFERMFGRPADPTADRSVLDAGAADAERIAKRLPPAERARIEQYLQSVREVERRIEESTVQRPDDPALAASSAELDGRIAEFNGDAPILVDLMLDLIALAFQADATRVGSLMFGRAVSNRSFAFLDGVTGSHHEMSHHENDAEKLRQYEVISTWHVSRFARLIARLKDIPEGDGSLLDHSALLFGSGIRDGNSHHHKNLPIVLAGRAGGAFSTGRHVVAPEETPLCNLHLDLLLALGVPARTFGDSTGPLLLARA